MKTKLQLDQRTYYAAAFRYDVLKFTTLCCPISITSKNDSVAGSANNSKVLVNEIAVYFTTYSFS